MTRLALVLSGGGLAGIAWETGVLTGIADAQPAVTRALLAADVLVGTSAGSAVAAQLGSGASLYRLYARQFDRGARELAPRPMAGLMSAFQSAAADPGGVAARLAALGEISARTDTSVSAARRAVIEGRLPSHQWPQRDLRITAIDIDNTELCVFGSDGAGADLVDAVTASCAVPGVWPAVQIGQRRFMDGGMASGVNLSVANDCDVAVVLVPAGGPGPSLIGASLADEIAAFAGPVHVVYADGPSLAAFGKDVLNPACRIPSARAGRTQGQRAAAAVGEFLGI